MTQRRFLFLQGVASPFFARLADHLSALGHPIYRINFNAGDVLYWGRRSSWSFRAGIEDLPQYLMEKFAVYSFTDVVLFGDQRPIHITAIAIARERGTRIHVVEEGYLRPNWFTLERDGVNAASKLPTDPAWYRIANRYLPRQENGEPAHSNLRIRALHDMAYHLANLVNPVVFPGYRTHRPYNALVEYLGWIRRFSSAPWYRRKDQRTIAALCQENTPFYVLPLQLNGDFQIARHSGFDSMRDVLAKVTESFAKHAPKDSLLVIKNHPLDTGLVNYKKTLRELTTRFALNDRLRYLESGDLAELLDHAVGTIAVNSTVGLSAILRGLPVCALGSAIYALPGLVHQGGLDGFWEKPEVPDGQLAAAFRNVVLHTTQVNGDLYTSAGIQQALQSVSRFLEPESQLDRCLALVADHHHPSTTKRQVRLT